MEARNAFICFLFIIQLKNLSSRYTDPSPIRFEFAHHETLSISDSDDEVEDYDYDYPIPIGDDSESQNSKHSRRRRSVKWAPDYDLYEQWAEEYYAQNEESEGNIESVVQPKQSLLDKLISKTQNRTQEEIELETKEEQQKRDILKSTVKYGTWTLGIVLIFCVVVTLIKRCWRLITCDFCDVFSYKKKIKLLINNAVPGVYVHKNGKKEFYKPTAEELDALNDIQKILFSLA